MKVLGVIPARAGSKRVPNKNRELIGGVELWARALRFGLRLPFLTQIVVSTDDCGIYEMAGFYGLRRPRLLAEDDTPMERVLMHALEACNGGFDAVATIQPTNPLRIRDDAYHCYRHLCEHSVCYSAATCDTGGNRDGNFYITRVDMLKAGLVFDRWTALVVSHQSCDINTPEDLERARELWSKLHS